MNEYPIRPFLLIIIFPLLFITFIPATAATDMTIIYSGNLDGDLEPCGCTFESDFGGFKRRVTLVDELRNTSPDLFLISSGGLLASYAASDRLTGEYILKGFEALDYDAIGVQWQDLSYGVDFIKAAHLPWIASNWKGPQFDNNKLIEHGGKKLAFFSWLEPAAKSHRITGVYGHRQQIRVGYGNLKRNLTTAKLKNVLTVLAARMNYKTALATLPLKHVDILIIEPTSERYAEPKMIKGTLVLRPGSRGAYLGRLDLTLDRGQIHSFSHQQIPLSPTIEDSPRMKAWYAQYNERVKQAYFTSAQIRKAIELGERNYVGADACRGCHQNSYNVWSASRHAKAFDSLALVNKAFDPNCIVCHTVGFNQEGGFIDYEDTPHLTDVQCESCHGAAREHMASNGKKGTEQQEESIKAICIQCHTHKNSPHFSLDEYWPKVAH